MTDTFTEFNAATHPIVKLEDDYNNLLAHGLEKGVSFIVRKNDSYYESINGSTGKIAYGGSRNVGEKDGTDANAVIQAAITALGALGGKIVFNHRGVISLTSKIVGANNIKLQGLGMGVTYLRSSHASDPVIETIGTVGSPIWDFAVSDFSIDAGFGDAVHLEYCHNSQIERLALCNMTHASNSCYGLYAKNCFIKGIFRDLFLVGNKNYGAYFENCNAAEATGLYCDSNIVGGVYSTLSEGIIIDGTFELGDGQEYGIKIYDQDATRISGYLESNSKEQIYIDGATGHECDGTIIEKAIVVGVPTYNVIYLKYARNTRIDNSFLESGDAQATSRQIYIHTNCEDTVIGPSNRFIVGLAPYVAIDGSAVRTRLLGYPFENSGTSTGTGAQQTIAHGCHFTPTYDQVFLSERSTGLAIPFQSAAPDETNIYVTATNAKTYNWRVNYNP